MIFFLSFFFVVLILHRDLRLEKDQINKGAQFKYGAYVYMGKRSETEW